MKSKSIYLLALLLTGISFTAMSQFRTTFRAQGNKLSFILRPSADMTNIGFSGIEIFLRYPSSSPAFTYTNLTRNTTNLPATGSLTITAQTPKDGFKVDQIFYSVQPSAFVKRNYTNGVEYEIFTVELSGDGSQVISEMQMVHREDESDFYLALNSDAGTDLRPGTLTNYFYPTTTVTGTGASAIYSLALSNVALPVKFLSFLALKSEDDAKLNWTVEGDDKNQFFEVERSLDGRTFRSFAKVNAVNNGRSVNTYELTDGRISGLGSQSVYYRIRQVDRDGNTTYSSIRNLNTTRRSTPVQLYPNPAKSTTKLVFDASNAGRGNVLVRDMQGKLVLQFNTQFIKGINQQDLNVSALASGDYNVTIAGEGFSHTLKLTKIN